MIDKLDKDSASSLLKLLSKFGISNDDPLIVGIHMLLETKAASAAATEAASAATTAADRITAATSGISDTIYKQATSASADLHGLIQKALAEQVTATGKALLQALERRMNAGAQKIDQAAARIDAGLDEAVRKKQESVSRRMLADAAEAVRTEVRGRYARSWTGIALTLLLTLALGAALAAGGLDLAGKIFPWGWRKNGTCGESVVIFQPPGQAAQRASLLSCGATQD